MLRCRLCRVFSLVGLLAVALLGVQTAVPARAAVTPGAPFLVRDIFSGADGSVLQLTALGQTLFFVADDGVHGAELWRSDGTAVGTTLVKDIVPGAADGELRELTAVGDWLAFVTDDGAGEMTLWRSDGTTAGTTPVTTMAADGVGNLTAVGDLLFFTVPGGFYGRTLWRSDGTAAGTFSLLALTDDRFFYLYEIGQELYFSTVRVYGVPDGALWKSDGTVAGTTSIKADFCYGPRGMTLWHGIVYFAGSFPCYEGDALWRTDGTEAGTWMLKSSYPGEGSSPQFFTPAGDFLFYATVTNKEQSELWRSDGTVEGTGPVITGSVTEATGPYELTNVNEELFFVATNYYFDYFESSNDELWRSDGTEAGTVLVKDIYPGVLVSSQPKELTPFSGGLFFAADDGVHGRELWRSDGTEAGTTAVADLFPGSEGADPQELTAIGDTLYFVADDGIHGRELWAVHGAPFVKNVAGCYVVALPGSPVRGPATQLDAAAPGLRDNGRSLQFNAQTWASAVGLSARACFEIHGTPRPDRLIGGSGPDQIMGYAGADVLNGRSGWDQFTGGADADRFIGGHGWDTVLDFAPGVDRGCSSVESGCR